MATAARAPSVLRSLLGRQQARAPPSCLSSSSHHQRRWARVLDVRFLATTQASRSVAEKYREKLDRKAREEGLRDIDELRAAYADRIQDLRKKDSVTVPGLDALLADAEPPAPSQPQPQSQPQGITQNPPLPPRPSGPGGSSGGASAVKPLSAILDMDKARALPARELGAVWRLRHAASPTSLCAVIPTATYQGLEATARRHPSFVLPVPRADVGAEMHYLQWVFAADEDGSNRTATVLFTQLAEYKARGEWAQPHTSVTHYWDEGFARAHGIVLMAGNLVEGRGASVQDAQWLVALLQRFYGEEGRGGDAEKRRLLEQFARGDGGFSVEKLLEESEKLG
ncbi:hypothetical protein DL770_001122 [Monosporascus sp. CRB-9-2]|nr:hypothetical protein DL770_001122 [Monosporascus sp. CRB-9-2]